MEMDPTTKKWLLYGGVGVAALVVGLYFFSGTSASATSSAPDPNALPITYSSGLGNTPIDTSGAGAGSTTGQSSLDYLNALLQLQAQQATTAADYNTQSLNVEQALGLANINANQSVALANVSATVTSDLTDLANKTTQALVNGKLSAISGNIVGGGQSLNYNVAALSRTPKYNIPLVAPSPGGGSIFLPGGLTVRAPNITNRLNTSF